MSEAIAHDQLRSFVERIERVEEEIRTFNDDKRDIYAEARSMGFDVKVLKRVVAERRKDANERQEADAVFDLYWEAVHAGTEVARVQAHMREAAE